MTRKPLRIQGFSDFGATISHRYSSRFQSIGRKTFQRSSVIVKRIEYKRSRQEYLAKKREEPYGQFVNMIYKIQQNTKKPNSYTEAQMLTDLSQFPRQITLWGFSRVVNKWVKSRENGSYPGLAQKTVVDGRNNKWNEKRLGLEESKKGTPPCVFHLG